VNGVGEEGQTRTSRTLGFVKLASAPDPEASPHASGTARPRGDRGKGRAGERAVDAT
jgi:hypothetical protein